MSDLTKPQAEILEAVRRLKRYGEIPTLSEVAKLLKKSPSALSGPMQALLRKGLIQYGERPLIISKKGHKALNDYDEKDVERPKHQHYCNACRYLGSERYKGKVYDIYKCKYCMEGDALIARWSKWAFDYHVLYLNEYGTKVISSFRQVLEDEHPLAKAFDKWQYGQI